jgi:peptidoglycan/LPS O-acetylase OafA/YrhL
MHHTAIRIPLEKGVLADWLPQRFLYGIQYDGFESVFLFFVISGFLITSNSLARWGALAAIDAKAFYRRRAARILPCLLILVAVLCGLALAGAPHYTMEQPKQTLPGAVMSALGLYLNVYQARTGWLPAGWGVLWSLVDRGGVLPRFPLACLLLGRTRLLVPALLALALSIPLVRAHPSRRDLGEKRTTCKAWRPSRPACWPRCWCGAGRRRGMSTVRWTTALGVVGLLAVYFAGTELWHSLRFEYMLVLTFSAAALVIASRWRAAVDHVRRCRRSAGCARSDASATRST